MTRLPQWLQLSLTWLSGKPYAGQSGPSMTATGHFVAALLSLCGGLALSTLAVVMDGPWVWWLALIPGWAATVHGMRNLRLMIFHQCAHRNMWNRPRLDRIVGKTISAALLIQSFERYQQEHVADHHALHHMTPRDPTVQAILLTLGLRPGMSRSRMWRRVLGRAFSPVFHLRFLWARVRSSLQKSAGTPTRVLTVVGHLAMIAGGVALGGWWLPVLAWLLPLTLFFQISNTFRLCVKHTFPSPRITQRRGREYFGGLTNAIFLGEAVPGRGRPRAAIAWARWWARMAFVHFPARYLVMTGDTVCHDFHHRRPMSREWPDYIFARERDSASGHKGWPAYAEVWGLRAAIDHVFDSLRAADPVEYDPDRIARGTEREMFAAFDD